MAYFENPVPSDSHTKDNLWDTEPQLETSRHVCGASLSKLGGTRMTPTPCPRLLWSMEKGPGGQRHLTPHLGRGALPWVVGRWTPR